MILDWNDAYTNGAYIIDGDQYPDRWKSLASAFRTSLLQAGRADIDIPYGPGERQKLDIFRPDSQSKGLIVFIHGGYWLRFDKSFWSHLAAGALDRGWTVAMPAYTLAPEHSVSEITTAVGNAVVRAAGIAQGPLILAGHSAGGHLATRMVCHNSPLPEFVKQRIVHAMSISGLHDLRPLLKTAMSGQLFRSDEEAARESPALLEPLQQVPVTCWVGSSERPEFVRQNDLLANIWTGLGASIESYHAPDQHHFNVIDGLIDPTSTLMEKLCGYAR